MRAVFDSNVYLAAASSPQSYSRQQLERARPNGLFELFISPAIILEIRDRLELKFGYSTEASANYIDMLLSYARLVQPRRRIRNVLRDADDHIVLECAVEVSAVVIVTADRELLKLGEFEKIKIIHPTTLQYLT